MQRIGSDARLKPLAIHELASRSSGLAFEAELGCETRKRVPFRVERYASVRGTVFRLTGDDRKTEL